MAPPQRSFPDHPASSSKHLLLEDIKLIELCTYNLHEVRNFIFHDSICSTYRSASYTVVPPELLMKKWVLYPYPTHFLHLWETLDCFQGSGLFSISRALHLKSSPCMLFLPLCLVKLYSFLQSGPKWTLPYSRLPWSWTRSVIPIVSSNSTRYFSVTALTTVL